ncbi:MAG: ribbon-helix-helix protein, CopG family [Candidatus Lokiarchaeota archaeon]|nr:ribbon-helix-helix protein, CopG family [Candidatus Lokiarchaeota archaeon]
MSETIRITFSIDEDAAERIERRKDELNISKSKMINEALNFYFKYEHILKNIEAKRLKTYLDMLCAGEHIILDIEHFILFLMKIEEIKDKDFWVKHKEIAKSHAEQLSKKIDSVDSLLERLEACNFFKIGMKSIDSYTLLLGSEITKKFIRVFLEEYCKEIGYKIEIKEGILKFRLESEPLEEEKCDITV